MDTFNKALSFILGLVVVVVFIAVFSGRLNLKSRLTSLTKGLTREVMVGTPTPTPKTVSGGELSAKTTQDKKTEDGSSQTKTITVIPKTGAPTLLQPLLLSLLFAGMYLKGMGKKSS